MNKEMKDIQGAEDFMLKMVAEPTTTVEPTPNPIPDAGAQSPIEPTSEGSEGIDSEIEPQVVVNSDDTGVLTEPTPPTVAEPAAVVAPVIDLDNWDDTPSTDPVADTVDYTKIGNALGVTDPVDSMDALVEKVKSQYKSEATEALEGIPEHLKEAVNFAKTGGDYLELLNISAIDYSKVDPRVMVENQLIELGMFVKDGAVDEEGMSEYLDSLPEGDILVRGTQLIHERVNEQDTRKQTLINAQASAKMEADKALKASIEKTVDVAGFKLNDTHRTTLFNEISGGEMLSSMFYDSNQNYDYDKMVSNYFKVKYFDKIQAFYKTKISNDTKREIINGLTNPDLGSANSLPDPQVQAQPTGLDLLMQNITTTPRQ